MTCRSIQTVLVTGGAGYVGAALAPKLLQRGYLVRILDTCWFGRHVLDDTPGLDLTVGDIRDATAVRSAMLGVDAVIHLACISNDPSFELDPALGRSINLDAFEPLVRAARSAGVQRFIYASSSSVYGLSSEPNVTEDHPLRPLTDYSRFKADCETILARYHDADFTTVTVRPATVCGYSRRQRLDLIVNILTNHAVHHGKVTVHGGSQLRPNIHIDDMTDLYVQLLAEPAPRIAGKTFNAGYHNHSLMDIARIVRRVVDPRLSIVVEPTNDLRSYHINSDRIAAELGFTPRRTIDDAVRDLQRAMRSGRIPRPLDDDRYYNIRTMQSLLRQRQREHAA